MAHRPPNILFVITDQQRSTALGCAGVEAVKTPHLDGLAAQGTRFTNAIANTPSCTPSRGTLLTGLHALRTGLITNDLRLGTQHRSLAHCLNDAGYACGWIGKWHLDAESRGSHVPAGPRRQGFDHYWAGVECNHQYMAGYHFDDATATPIWHDRYEPEVQTDLALDFLRRHQADAPDRPFCLVVSWGPPHCPYDQVPQRYKDLYDPATLPLMPTAESALLTKSQFALPILPADLDAAGHDSAKRRIIRDYYAACSALDEQMGRLLGCLDELALTSDTLVVYTSDHGDMLFNHNRGWKCKPWRESVGIPLLMRWPGHIPAGRVSNGPIGIADLMPTLVTLAGGQVPADIDGADRSAHVLGDEAAAADEQYINYPCCHAGFSFLNWRGLVTATHTYACNRDGAWLLFDDQADPRQTRNLANDPAYADLQADLHARTLAWLQRTGDAFLSSRELAERVLGRYTDDLLPIRGEVPAAIRDGQRARLTAWRDAGRP